MMTLVPSYQKVPKVKIACSYSKEGDLFVDSKQTMACLQNFRVVYVKYVYYLTKIWDQNLEANLLKPGADSGGGPRRLVPHLNLTSKASLKT